MKRVLRVLVYLVGSLALLLALFHLEENWRGKRDWERWKAAQEAKGVRYDLAAFAPPEVPDAENFAKAPIVAEAILGQKSLLPGFPWPDSTPCPNPWRLGERMDLNAWRSAFQCQDIESKMSPWKAQFEALSAASRRPSSRFPVSYTVPEALDDPYLSMQGVRFAARLLELRSIERTRRGEAAGALEDVLTLLRVARHFGNEPGLSLSQMQTTYASNAIPPIREGLAEHGWNSDQLAVLEARLQEVDLLASNRREFERERVYGVVSGLWTLDHTPSSWALARDSSVEADDFDGTGILRPHRMRALRFWLTIPKGWFYQNRATSDRFYAQHWLPALDPGGHRIDARDLRWLAETHAVPRSTPFNWAGGFMIPLAVAQISHLAEHQSALDEALLACALERFRLAKGTYPASLAELSPTYLARIPNDVVTGEPLHYRSNADGTFTLYSVGWDGTDDGGQAATKKKGAFDLDHGDWPWPSPKK